MTDNLSAEAESAFAEYEGITAKELAETVARYGTALSNIAQKTLPAINYQQMAREALRGVTYFAPDHYFAVDYTGCIHEAPDRETAIKWAEDFARTANGGAIGSERPEVAAAIGSLARRAAVPSEQEPVALACTKCNSPRSIDPCPKCGTPLVKPAKGWEWPRLPDVDRIRALAREVGYAVGVHGSLERDLDLIAAPWVAEAVGPMALAEHIAAGLGGRVVDFERQDKPCGRWSCNIHTPDWTKMIDLSVMPPIHPAPAARVKVKALKWKYFHAIGADTPEEWFASTPEGQSLTVTYDESCELPWVARPFPPGPSNYATADEAKAALEAAREAHIRRALDIGEPK